MAPFEKQFPPATCWELAAPAHVLREGWGDPLEAALLIGALTQKAAVYRRFGLQVVLFILPQGEKEPHQQVLLAWTTTDNLWQAVNMAQANTLTFEKNVPQTTAQLQQFLAQTPDLPKSLKTKGLWLDQVNGSFALDFDNAAKQFRIRGLP